MNDHKFGCICCCRSAAVQVQFRVNSVRMRSSNTVRATNDSKEISTLKFGHWNITKIDYKKDIKKRLYFENAFFIWSSIKFQESFQVEMFSAELRC